MNRFKKYPKYRRSSFAWLGEIPEHWNTSTIKRLCVVYSGGTPSKSIIKYWENGTIPWLSSGEVNKRRISSAKTYITEEALFNSSAKWIPKGSIIIALAGQGKTKGKVATIEEPMTGNQSLAAIVPNASLLNYNFLALYLESKYKQIRGLVGDGLRDGLNLEHIKDIAIPLPPNEEQAEIVSFLDCKLAQIDQFIVKKKQLIRLLSERKNAIINKAVIKGLDPNAPMKDSGIECLGFIPKHWEVNQLKTIANITRLAGAEYTSFWEIKEDGEIKVLRGQNIGFNKIIEKSIDRISNELSMKLKRSKLYKGDIVFPCVGSVGNAVVIEENDVWHINQNIAKITPVGIDSNYLCFYLLSHSAKYQIFLHNTSDMQPSVLVGNLRKFAICFPKTLDEQKEIVDFINLELSKINKAINHLTKEILLIEEYRTAFIAEAVTGKINVLNYALENKLESVEVEV